MNVTSPTGVPDDDAYWKRPDPDSGVPVPPKPPQARNSGPRYEGPPRPGPASPHWRPPTIATPPAARSMPPQDMDALDEAEGSARTLTYGVGLVTGAIALILTCLVCGRILF